MPILYAERRCVSNPFFPCCVALLAGNQAAQAFTVNTKPLTSTQKNIETLGTGLSIALPLTAGVIAWSKHDRIGLAQLTAETVLTVGTAYALKNIVRERRPNGSDFKSFPPKPPRARFRIVFPVGPLWLAIWLAGVLRHPVRVLQPHPGQEASLV